MTPPLPRAARRHKPVSSIFGYDRPARETELLTHLAAGTDIWTALAALPDEEKPVQKRRACLWCIGGASLGVSAFWWCL